MKGFVFLILLGLNCQAANDQIEVTLSQGKKAFNVREPISLIITIINNGPNPVTLYARRHQFMSIKCATAHHLDIAKQFPEPGGGSTGLIGTSVAPRKSVVLTEFANARVSRNAHSWLAFPPGDHTIDWKTTLRSYDNTTESEFAGSIKVTVLPELFRFKNSDVTKDQYDSKDKALRTLNYLSCIDDPEGFRLIKVIGRVHPELLGHSVHILRNYALQEVARIQAELTCAEFAPLVSLNETWNLSEDLALSGLLTLYEDVFLDLGMRPSESFINSQLNSGSPLRRIAALLHLQAVPELKATYTSGIKKLQDDSDKNVSKLAKQLSGDK